MQVPFVKERERYTLATDTRLRVSSSWVKKLQTYIEFPAFSIANTWRGASEIIRKYNFNLDNKNSIVNLFSSVPTGANFCPCISWKPTEDTIVRYKLWEDVGEILWVPLYEGQTINADFAIEIWNTPAATITLPAAQVLYLSKLVIPTSRCDTDGIQVGLDFRICTDWTFEIEEFVPRDGDYYIYLSDCGVTELIKNTVFADGWLVEATDGTWHYLKLTVFEGTVFTYFEPTATPNPEPTPYLPIIDLFSGLGFQYTAYALDGNYHNYVSTLVDADVVPYGVVYLKADDDQYYGVRLVVEDWNSYPLFFPADQVTTGTFRIEIDQTPTSPT